MSGFFLMHRGWRDNPVLQGDFSRADAWVWLIENAAWKPTRTRVKGRQVVLNRGEMTFSVRFLAEQWGWSKSSVARFLAELRENEMIETRPMTDENVGTVVGQNPPFCGTANAKKMGQSQTIIKLCNYEKYQAKEERSWDSAGTGVWDTPPSKTAKSWDKEEQDNKTTYPVRADALTDAAASQPRTGKQGSLFGEDEPEEDDEPEAPAISTAALMKKAVFDAGRNLLVSAGQRNPGALIQRWRQHYPDHVMIDVLARAEGECPEDPVAWITAALKNATRRNAGAPRSDLPQTNNRDGALSYLHSRMGFGDDQEPPRQARRWDDESS